MQNEEKVFDNEVPNYDNDNYLEILEELGIKVVTGYKGGQYLKFTTAILAEATKFPESEIEDSIKSLLNGKSYVQTTDDDYEDSDIEKGKLNIVFDGVSNFIRGKIDYEYKNGEYFVTPNGFTVLLEKLKEANEIRIPYERELAKLEDKKTKLNMQIVELELIDSEKNVKEFEIIEDEKVQEILKMLVNNESNIDQLNAKLKQYWEIRNERAILGSTIEAERERIANFHLKNTIKKVDNYCNVLAEKLADKKNELANEKENLSNKVQFGIDEVEITKLKELQVEVDDLFVEHYCLTTDIDDRLEENDTKRAQLISEFKHIGGQLLLIEFEILEKEYELMELENHYEKMSIEIMNKKLPIIEKLEILKSDKKKKVSLRNKKLNIISQIGIEAYEKMKHEEFKNIYAKIEPLNVDEELNSFRIDTKEKSRQIWIRLGELNPYINVQDNQIIDNSYQENVQKVYNSIIDEITNLKLNKFDNFTYQEKIQYIENIILLSKNNIVERENDKKYYESVLVTKKAEREQLINEKTAIESLLLTKKDEYIQVLEESNKKRKQKKAAIMTPKIILVTIAISAIIIGVIFVLICLVVAAVIWLLYHFLKPRHNIANYGDPAIPLLMFFALKD